MHCTCMKRPYFHFWFKIGRHHRVPRPRFPIRRTNFDDSRTFKADIVLLNICMGFQDFWPKMEVLCGKIGEGVVRY